MIIRPGRPADAEAIARVHVETWRAAYRGIVSADYLDSLSVEEWSVKWRGPLEAGVPEIWTADRQGEVVGWISFGDSRDEDSAGGSGELWGIYVSAAWWSCGVGRELWLAARRRLSERGFVSVTVWVLSENSRAIRFYERQGFLRDESPEKMLVIGGGDVPEIRMARSLGD